MSTNRLTLLSMNLLYGGLTDSDGGTDDRLQQLAELVRAQRPTVVCAQELKGWDGNNHRALARWLRATGLSMAGWLTHGRSRSPVGICFDPSRCAWDQWETAYAAEHHHGLGVAVLDVGTSTPLTVISAHLTPYDAAAADTEAKIMAARIHRYGGVGIIAGDINHFPDDGAPAPDPDSIPPYNVSSRWIDQDGTLIPNRRVAHTLKRARLTDAAVEASERALHPHDQDPLAPTGRGGVRVDQAWLTAAVRPALTGYRRIAHPASDHDAIEIEVDLSRLDLRQAQKEWI